MKLQKKFSLLIAAPALAFLLSACATKPVPPEPIDSREIKPATKTRDLSRPEPLVIDYQGLQNSLGLIKEDEKLGYFERAFNTCQAGFGYPSDTQCRRDYFVLIHFRLLCRDAHESSQTAFDSSRIQPLSGRSVKWNLPGLTGLITLDGEGHGQIRTTSRNSQRTQRLRLNADNEVLYMRAGEISKVVAPPDWCD